MERPGWFRRDRERERGRSKAASAKLIGVALSPRIVNSYTFLAFNGSDMGGGGLV